MTKYDRESCGGDVRLPQAGIGKAARLLPRRVKRPVALVLGPRREAVSGVTTHVNLLCASQLAEDYRLVHFQVGSEGRSESALGRLVRLLVSPIGLALAILWRGAAIVHIHVRHPDVAEEGVEEPILEQVERFGGRGGARYLVPPLGEGLLEEQEDGLLVVYD